MCVCVCVCVSYNVCICTTYHRTKQTLFFSDSIFYLLAVDGNWSSWARWSQVTVTCGLGMRERRRRCDNPRPNFCGRSCPGAELERDMYDTRVSCEPLCGKAASFVLTLSSLKSPISDFERCRIQARSRGGRWSWAPKVGQLLASSVSSTVALRTLSL